jgi:secretion/DNA translocation related CpaE-like protein
MASAVVGVVGGSGGAGASTLAAALACGMSGPSVLIDLDPVGSGIDVLLGIESVPGARWPGLQLGGGRLDPDVFERGLPSWGDVRVLAAPSADPGPDAVEQVIDAACALGSVVIDLGRGGGDGRAAALHMCDLVVLLAAGSVAGIAAARRVLSALPAVSVGAVLRRGSVREGYASELLGVPILVTLPDVLRRDGVVPSSWIKIGRGVADGLVVGAR